MCASSCSCVPALCQATPHCQKHSTLLLLCKLIWQQAQPYTLDTADGLRCLFPNICSWEACDEVLYYSQATFLINTSLHAEADLTWVLLCSDHSDDVSGIKKCYVCFMTMFISSASQSCVLSYRSWCQLWWWLQGRTRCFCPVSPLEWRKW